MTPLATDVGQHGRDLLVGEGSPDWRHQPNGAFLSVKQDARRNIGRREGEHGSHQWWGNTILTAAVRLMAPLADVSVELSSVFEPAGLGRRERRRGRRCSWLARPDHFREDGV